MTCMHKTLPEWAKGQEGLPPIIAVAAWKGGDGKSLTARELAYLLGAVLVDFDWDRGCSSRYMGFRHEKYVGRHVLDAIEKGRVPVPIKGRRKADLVPSHPDWQDEQPDRETITDALIQWAKAWQRPVVVDNHPGACESTYGAVNAADTIVVPSVLTKESLNALEGMIDELTDYPLLVVPNKVNAPPAWARKRLRDIVTRHDIPVGPKISFHRFLETRSRNFAISSEPVPKRAQGYVTEMDAVAEAVINYD